MSAATPGQSPRDVLYARLLDAAHRIKQCEGSEVVCASCRHEINDVMDAADAYAAAQDARPAPECDDSGDDCPAHGEPKAAPALAAAIDPAKLDLLADWFDVDDLAKGRSGRTEVQEDLRRWAEAIRDARQLPPGLTAVEAVRTAVAEEWQPRVDALRELLDEIGVMAANAPEDGDSFGVLEEIAMRIAAAGLPS